MTSHLSNHQPKEYLELAQLYQFAHGIFPNDENFASWTWKTLLRDRNFYRLFPVKSNVIGRPFELDVRHKVTGRTRDEWAREIAMQGHLHRWSELQEPKLWVIGKESLMSQYNLLYVDHDKRWHCTDSVRHDAYAYSMPPGEVDKLLISLPSSADRQDWVEQARVQDINPCVYSLVHWWMATLPVS